MAKSQILDELTIEIESLKKIAEQWQARYNKLQAKVHRNEELQKAKRQVGSAEEQQIADDLASVLEPLVNRHVGRHPNNVLVTNALLVLEDYKRMRADG